MNNIDRTLINNTLNKPAFLSQDIVYEVGNPRKRTGFLGGLLKSVQLPDVTIKPHPNMIYLILGTVTILAAGAVGTALIIKSKRRIL